MWWLVQCSLPDPTLFVNACKKLKLDISLVHCAECVLYAVDLHCVDLNLCTTLSDLLRRQVFVALRDGTLPEMFSGVHVTFRTPMPALLLQVYTIGGRPLGFRLPIVHYWWFDFQAFIGSVMIAIGNIDQLIDAFSASAWTFYGLAIGALLIMRITHEDVPRSFEVSWSQAGLS